MVDLLPFLFAQIDKIFENFVRPDEYLPTPMNIVFQYFTHVCINYNPPMNPVRSFIWTKFKMVDLLPFLFAQIAKIFEILSIRMNISFTNAYLFLILYTCINYIPPMNPVKFCQDQIQNGRLLAIFVCSN